MRLSVSVFVFVAILSAIAVPAYSADIAKIGVVDFQRLITESEAGKNIQAQLQAKGREMETDLRALGTEIEELEKELKQRATVISKEKREEMQREMDIKKYDLNTRQKKYQKQLRELENNMLEKLQSEVFSLAEEIGKKEGYLLIIEKSAAIYYPSSIDITDTLIEKYNESYQESDSGADSDS
jgi:outer membrane protein